MKDLTEQIYDELNAQVVRMLEHSLNQASRIAELETKLQEQDAMLGRRPCINNRCMDMVSAQSRIADLERQLAEASAPAVERQQNESLREGVTILDDMIDSIRRHGNYTKESTLNFLSQLRQCIALPSALPDDAPAWAHRIRERDAKAAAPQAADTDKVREAILALRIVPPRHYDNAQISAFCLGAKTMCEEAAKLTASMAAQAPVREVPGWQPIETAPKDGSHILCYAPKLQFVGFYGDPINKWCYMAPGVPIAPTQPTHWMLLPTDPVQPEPKP